MIKLKSLIVEETAKPLTVYHGTDKAFRRFSLKSSVQGIIWFTSDKNKILNKGAGAAGEVYVITAEVTMNKAAGWKEYEELFLAQLRSLGYDGAILPMGDGNFDCFIFSPNQAKIIKVEKV